MDDPGNQWRTWIRASSVALFDHPAWYWRLLRWVVLRVLVPH
jgi:hypothetical protein